MVPISNVERKPWIASVSCPGLWAWRCMMDGNPLAIVRRRMQFRRKRLSQRLSADPIRRAFACRENALISDFDLAAPHLSSIESCDASVQFLARRFLYRPERTYQRSALLYESHPCACRCKKQFLSPPASVDVCRPGIAATFLFV